MLLIFGLGYTATCIAAAFAREGWQVTGTTRDGRDGSIAFDDEGAVAHAIATATHILSSVPPAADRDAVLDRYGALLGRARWLGYLSSTGVYGDAGGGWVDETAPTGTGRRTARAAADAAWLDMGARVFRLPGIYGSGRSALDRVAEGKAHRTGDPHQVFSRIHVDDIASAVLAARDAPPGAYNIADDHPAPQDEVAAFAARLLGLPPPPLVAVADLSPMARAFHAENRRVANGKAKRVLGWTPVFPDYRLGLRALNAQTRPAIARAAPAPASSDQR